MTALAPNPTDRVTRMGQLDSVRAFGILFVFIEHWGGQRLNEWMPIGAGTLGVGVFFTLSGFLITGTLLTAFDKPGADMRRILGQFYIRRFFRLAPAYYLTLLVLMLLNIRDLGTSWPWHAAYLSNIYVALGGQSNVFWTLAVEEQFYLFWPILLLLSPGDRRLRSAIALILFGLLCRLLLPMVVTPQFRLTIFQLELLGAGCLLACLSHRPGGGVRFDWLTPSRLRTFTIVAFCSLGSATLVWLFFNGRHGGAIRYYLNEPLTAVFYAWVVCMSARGVAGAPGRLLDSRILQYIGRISYGLYLVHSFVPSILTRLLGPLPMSVAAPLTVVVTFAACAFSWRFIETPLIRFGRSLAAGMDKRGTAPDVKAPIDASSSRRDAIAK